MSDAALESPCPCTSGKQYEECCKPWHEGASAPTPEALMRSRFAAFRLELEDYLRRTWHEATRPIQLSFEGNPDWQSLRINSHSQNGDSGAVDFTAIYRTTSGWAFLAEASRFERIGGQWLYRDGVTQEGTLKPGRNEPCPCGSGRKFKACCQS